MFNCKWKGKIINAYEISKSELTEKEIRIAAQNGELECICPDCESNKLIYKYGDQRSPHFAHKKDSNCAYNQFEADDKPLIRNIRNAFFKHFISKGYDVEQEVYFKKQKIFLHLLLHIKGEKIALQIAEESISPKKIAELSQACSGMGYKLQWLVIGDVNAIQDKYHNHHIQRFLLNESKNKELIIIDSEAKNVTQARIINSSNINLNINLDIDVNQEFHISAPLSQLTIENGELTIEHFQEKYTHRLKNVLRSSLDIMQNKVYRLRDSIEKNMERLQFVANQPNDVEEEEKEIYSNIDFSKFQIGTKVYHGAYLNGIITDSFNDYGVIKVKIKFESQQDVKTFSAIDLAKSSRFKFI